MHTARRSNGIGTTILATLWLHFFAYVSGCYRENPYLWLPELSGFQAMPNLHEAAAARLLRCARRSSGNVRDLRGRCEAPPRPAGSATSKGSAAASCGISNKQRQRRRRCAASRARGPGALTVVRNNSISIIDAPSTYKATQIGWEIVSSICGQRGPRYLATVIARIATPHIAVPAAYRLEVHLLRKLPDS
jgi:hypothetical protein